MQNKIFHGNKKISSLIKNILRILRKTAKRMNWFIYEMEKPDKSEVYSASRSRIGKRSDSRRARWSENPNW